MFKVSYNDAQVINMEINCKIKTMGEILLTEIEKHQYDIEEFVKVIIPEDVVLESSKHNECFKSITQTYSAWMRDLSRFKQEALALERQREEKLKLVLKNNFHKVVQVGHMPPKDVLHHFDERIFEINQQLSSNCRAYLELEAQLRNKAEECVARARSYLNELCIPKTKQERIHSAGLCSNRTFQRKRSTSLDCAIAQKSSQVTMEKIFDTEQFITYISQLVQAYRKAVLKVYLDFSGHLENLRSKFDDSTFIDKPRDSVVMDFQSALDLAFKKICNNASGNQKLNNTTLDITHDEVINMQKCLSSFGDRLQSTYSILYDAGHLWDAHILRSALVQKLTMTGIEDMMTVHDSSELLNEVNFNVTLEQLRGAPDVDKLRTQYNAILLFLDRALEFYHQHNQTELKKLEDFMSLPPVMCNILKAEYNCLLEKYPKSNMTSNQSLTATPELSRRHILIALRTPLPEIVLQTHLNDNTLNNWRNGFLESLSSHMSLVADKVNSQMRKWTDDHIIQINMRYSLKLMSHSVRAERAKAAYELRLAELKMHDSRINSHIQAIHDVVETLPVKASECIYLDSPELYPLCYWVEKIKKDIDELLTLNSLDLEIKNLKFSSYAPRLANLHKYFKDSLEVASENCKTMVKEQLQCARISTLEFISNLKLSLEDGKFASAEATKHSSMLLKAAEMLDPCLTKSLAAIDSRRNLILGMADQLLSPLLRIVSDITKDTKVNSLNKKSTTRRKK
ncbi:uncharacterized protein LOC126978101 [Leptidea sinapis]|uniref:uncharacterized protein LOC126978101 n=1 Tax=Leptidea sinapis TaxID=189913 RepID=UPI0021C393A8|nr:uncharacterized protein LOC126978101 [Leptidea sinapis]